MIQPLDTARNSWRLLWLDLEEPVRRATRMGQSDAEPEYYLPTCLLVTNAAGNPICPPEIHEELDQSRVEQFLGRLFEEHGSPHHLIIAESDDWEIEAWRDFALDYRLEISFSRPPPAKPGALRMIERRLQAERFHSPSTVARGLVYSSRSLRSPEKRAAYLRKALEKDAECSEARIELADADYQAERMEEAGRGYLDVIEREKRKWRGESPAWWADPETRPYLRALYGSAMTEWQRGNFTEAASLLAKILSLNPTDNQGVRFLIPLVHLLAEDHPKALSALGDYALNYPDDYCEPSLLFGRSLACLLAGDEEGARASCRAAILKNIYIAPQLLDLQTPPGDLWHPNDRAEPGYAQDFIKSYATLWDSAPAALRLVRETHEELIPRLEQIIALRREMSDWQDQRYDREFKKRWKEMSARDKELTGES